MSEPNKATAHTIEINRLEVDTSKSAFTIHAVDAKDRPVLRRDLKRVQFEAFLAKQTVNDSDVFYGSQSAIIPLGAVASAATASFDIASFGIFHGPIEIKLTNSSNTVVGDAGPGAAGHVPAVVCERAHSEQSWRGHPRSTRASAISGWCNPSLILRWCCGASGNEPNTGGGSSTTSRDQRLGAMPCRMPRGTTGHASWMNRVGRC
jgi:hypothetical protein